MMCLAYINPGHAAERGVFGQDLAGKRSGSVHRLREHKAHVQLNQRIIKVRK